MIEIGLTSAALTALPKETNASGYDFIPDAQISLKKNIQSAPFLTGSGYVKTVIRRDFEHISPAELETVKQWCVPFNYNKLWVKITNSLDAVTFEGFALVVLDIESVQTHLDDQTRSCSITIYQA